MLDTRAPSPAATPEAPARRRLRAPAAVLVTLAIVLAAEAGVRAIAFRLPEPSAWNQRIVGMMASQMRALGETDAAFVGSSVVSNAFDPATFAAETGLSSYNSGLQRAGMQGIDRWAREVVLPSLRPRLVVLGLTSRDLNDNGPLQRAHLEEYLSSPGRARLLGIESLSQRAERIASRASSLVRYRRYLRRPGDLLDQVARGNQALEPPVALGARGEPLDAEANAPFHLRDWAFPHRNGELFGFSMTRSLAILERLVADLRAQGVRVVLVDMPVLEDVYVPFHPRGRADLEAYRDALAGVAARTGVALLAPDHASWDRFRFSVDDLHLNRAGAVRATRELAAMLQREGILPSD